MPDPIIPRFTPQNKATHERLSTNTVGLVALSDFRKRRAEVLEQQEREAREAAISGTSTSAPDRSLTGSPDQAASDSASGPGAGPLKKKKKKKKKEKDKNQQRQQQGKKLLSFADEGEEGDGALASEEAKTTGPGGDAEAAKRRLKANASVGVVPRAVTKAALLKEAAEREALRREFVAIQEAVKATEFAIPFIYYDGANIPGGTVRVSKGDFIWVFLDRSRKVAAERRPGEHGNQRRAWARVGVDDLMLVRDTVIIPHHYDFYFFIINKCVGPTGLRLFDHGSEAPLDKEGSGNEAGPSGINHLSTAASRAAAAQSVADIKTLEGAADEPARTKIVDRRWYERNKHIYPASTWQHFDPEKDYAGQIRKDTGGNTYFFSK
ncbi:uncharacterized protein UV8b_00227 [Ustilaginoidea virens]|uniref:FAM50A/XAP5 C-terminal domain-containing protein n=1 Tax=Ustilaginoidea virens TaxID=1159556 RepID=A0A063CA81_USTVR|nr:uncharacterized protein UV8b_00227 [Ustilaginoidea virens]QUC15986.1 hypothetical protein UV8b_00227 [Ustilaginoidea virens]GAO17343.1 hypothetical protein UVI_02038630 [Ustilaginoidea virens]